jgi:hypothetical protein
VKDLAADMALWTVEAIAAKVAGSLFNKYDSAATTTKTSEQLDDAVADGAKAGAKIENDVLGSARAGSAIKTDPLHAFPDMVDNYAGDAAKFSIPAKGPGGVVTHQSDLYQVEGTLNGKPGIFEWIVDQGQVTHRRFILNGTVTGFPNQIPPKP